MIAVAPGYGLPSEAKLEYQEIFRLATVRDWELILYRYEYRTADGGRRAYHFHDRSYHAHCVAPHETERDHHYRATEIELFEAHDEFRSLYVSGTVISCSDLRPVLDRSTDGATLDGILVRSDVPVSG